MVEENLQDVVEFYEENHRYRIIWDLLILRVKQRYFLRKVNLRQGVGIKGTEKE